MIRDMMTIVQRIATPEEVKEIIREFGSYPPNHVSVFYKETQDYKKPVKDLTQLANRYLITPQD